MPDKYFDSMGNDMTSYVLNLVEEVECLKKQRTEVEADLQSTKARAEKANAQIRELQDKQKAVTSVQDQEQAPKPPKSHKPLKVAASRPNTEESVNAK